MEATNVWQASGVVTFTDGLEDVTNIIFRWAPVGDIEGAGKASALIHTTPATDIEHLDGGPVITDNEWHHLQITVGPSITTLSVDFEVVDWYSSHGPLLVNGNWATDIGCKITDDPAHFFPGDIDQVRIWDAARPDYNANGIPDSCGVAAETSPDENGNGIPDECENTPPTCRCHRCVRRL